MLEEKKINRRNILKSTLGVLGAVGAGKALGEFCFGETATQPLGPFFPRPGTPTIPVREDQNPQTPIYLANDNDLTKVKGVAGEAQGQVVYVKGTLFDKNCKPLPEATIIIWQASESGRYNHTGDSANIDFSHPRTGVTIRRVLDRSFQYWGKTISNERGEYLFKTVVPGFYPADLGSKWYRPPHIHFLVSAPGTPQFVTQMYFKGDVLSENEWIQELNKRDGLLQTDTMTQEQREKLVVQFAYDRNFIFSDAPVGTFDIYL